MNEYPLNPNVFKKKHLKPMNIPRIDSPSLDSDPYQSHPNAHNSNADSINRPMSAHSSVSGITFRNRNPRDEALPVWQSNPANAHDKKLGELSPYALLGIETCKNVLSTAFSKSVQGENLSKIFNPINDTINFNKKNQETSVSVRGLSAFANDPLTDESTPELFRPNS